MRFLYFAGSQPSFPNAYVYDELANATWTLNIPFPESPGLPPVAGTIAPDGTIYLQVSSDFNSDIYRFTYAANDYGPGENLGPTWEMFAPRFSAAGDLYDRVLAPTQDRFCIAIIDPVSGARDLVYPNDGADIIIHGFMLKAGFNGALFVDSPDGSNTQRLKRVNFDTLEIDDYGPALQTVDLTFGSMWSPAGSTEVASLIIDTLQSIRADGVVVINGGVLPWTRRDLHAVAENRFGVALNSNNPALIGQWQEYNREIDGSYVLSRSFVLPGAGTSINTIVPAYGPDIGGGGPPDPGSCFWTELVAAVEDCSAGPGPEPGVTVYGIVNDNFVFFVADSDPDSQQGEAIAYDGKVRLLPTTFTTAEPDSYASMTAISLFRELRDTATNMGNEFVQNLDDITELDSNITPAGWTDNGKLGLLYELPIPAITLDPAYLYRLVFDLTIYDGGGAFIDFRVTGAYIFDPAVDGPTPSDTLTVTADGEDYPLFLRGGSVRGLNGGEPTLYVSPLYAGFGVSTCSDFEATSVLTGTVTATALCQ